jgi:cyclopropane fatty-acyl-phospholipid synthase-like methyltransferase
VSLLEEARLRERNYHIAFYAKHTLGDAGTWLAGPAPYALDSLRYVPQNATRALDLGAGIGRHAIPIAQYLGPGSEAVCIDILASALGTLHDNAREAGIDSRMTTLVADAEAYEPEGLFDFVLSVSAIEHVSSRQSLRALISRLQAATQVGGVHCFMIATQHQWLDAATSEPIEPLVELNMTAHEMQDMLRQQYEDWKIKDLSTKTWETNESHNGKAIICNSTCVQFTASNRGRK